MGGRGASSGGGGGSGGGSHGGQGGGGEQNNAATKYVLTYKSPSGGQVLTEQGRIDQANRSPNEKAKFEKEQRIAEKLADDGHKVVHLEDGKKEDSNGENKGTYDALVDGVKVDFKETSGSGNVVKYGKEAIRHQKAEKVVFNFTKFDAKTEKAIAKLSELGIHGYYYKPGTRGHIEF